MLIVHNIYRDLYYLLGIARS